MVYSLEKADIINHLYEIYFDRSVKKQYYISCDIVLFVQHLLLCALIQTYVLCSYLYTQSLNGVWVNGNRIAPGQPFLLHQGNSVRLGVPLDGNPVEFDYLLVQRPFSEVKPFLSGNPSKESSSTSSGLKLKNSKRKFDGDESESCPTQHSKSKLYRCSWPDKSHAQPCPSVERRDAEKCSSRTSEGNRSGDKAGSSQGCSESSQQLASVHQYNKNLMALKGRVGETQKRAAQLESQQRETPEREREMQELQAQLEMLRGQLKAQQEQALKRMESLEKSFCEEERRLEVRIQKN